MKKYIEVDELQGLIGHGVCIQQLQELIRNAEEGVNLKAIQDIVESHNRGNINSSRLVEKIKSLIPTIPNKYGGLTVDDWTKLSKLSYVMVSGYLDSGIHNYELNSFINRNGSDDTIRLLPDPENHIRAHISTEQPVPNNVLVQLYYMGGTVTPSIRAGNINWIESALSGYRIIGVDGE